MGSETDYLLVLQALKEIPFGVGKKVSQKAMKRHK